MWTMTAMNKSNYSRKVSKRNQDIFI